MLAIAGGKGGCGKTTTTLGLAGALGRARRSVLATDADVDMPDLHLLADVEPTPNLAEVAADGDVETATHPPPNLSGVGIVPAPQSIGERVSLSDALAHLVGTADHVLVDCPAGAGPDAVTPLRVADHVLLVTTPTPACLRDAAKTAAMARALGTTIVGVVLTRAERAPEENRTSARQSRARVDSGRRCRGSLRRIGRSGVRPSRVGTPVQTLMNAVGVVGIMAGRLSTGVPVLDRKLDGGIPPGSTVALCAPPASQAELLLTEFAASRPTLYLTTDRDEETVSTGFRREANRRTPEVRYIPGDAPLDHARRLFQRLRSDSTLIIDPADLLEREDPTRYRNFLHDLQAHLRGTDSLALLHCLDGRSVPDQRDITEHAVDVVFQLRTEISGDRVENRLAVPKFRGGRALPETIKLELTESVAIDTSRDIA